MRTSSEKRAGLLIGKAGLMHDTGPFHPESPQRLFAIEKSVQPLRDRFETLHSIAVDESILELVHPPVHIDTVKNHCDAHEPIDADTICSAGSWEAALHAVGAGIVAVDRILSDDLRRVFCGVRPPGHHATAHRAMGFCLFNNVAITARYAQRKGFARIAIVDFDVHHGNGTQEIFYDDPTVLYFSTHQSPAFPGTGSKEEKGSKDAIGTNLNIPLPPGTGDEELLVHYTRWLPQVLRSFSPQLMIVSAGYDIHEADPLAQFAVSTEGVQRIVRAILDAADIPTIFMLEGGYNLDALGECVAATLEEILQF